MQSEWLLEKHTRHGTIEDYGTSCWSDYTARQVHNTVKEDHEKNSHKYVGKSEVVISIIGSVLNVR